jgi:hypothetical protein
LPPSSTTAAAGRCSARSRTGSRSCCCHRAPISSSTPRRCCRAAPRCVSCPSRSSRRRWRRRPRRSCRSRPSATPRRRSPPRSQRCRRPAEVVEDLERLR